MRRQAVMITLIAGIVLVGVLGARAHGSGGFACHLPVSLRHATEVMIRDYCFQSTVVFVDPGNSVTWTNRDAEKHNVTGANGLWLGKPMRFRDAVTLRFRVPGVFPYYCQFHPGMTGTVVVGNPADGEIGLAPPPAVDMIDFREAATPTKESSKVEQVDSRPAADRAVDDGSWFWVSLLLLGALLLAGMIFLALTGKRAPKRDKEG